MSDKDLLAQARADFSEAEDLWKDNRLKWIEVQNFRGGEHWPEKLKKDREDKGRPVVTVDKTEQHVRQVVNDGRQNRPGAKVSPVDDKADIETAKAFKGIIRSIFNRSNADEAFDTALDHAAGNGFGFIRVTTEREHEKAFNQEIKVRRVRNPMAVLLGPHQLADGSDARYGFTIEEVPKKDYKKRWPKAKVSNFESDAFRDGWSSETHIRVCEYFYTVDEQVELCLLDDSTVVTLEEYVRDTRPARTDREDPAQQEGYKPAIVEQEVRSLPRVKWCRLSGAEILEKNKWASRYIPIVPVYGVERDTNGKVRYSGLIEPAMDAQRLYDYARAGFAEHVSLSTRVPWVAAEGQLEGHADVWERSNTENVMVLQYKPLDINGTPLPPPMRSPGSSIPAGLAQDMELSEHDIQGAMGQYAASLGERSNEKSGKAILARQREGDTGTFHYQDNLNRAIRYLCRIIVDLAPSIYDSRRVARMLGEDGVVTMAVIDPDQKESHRKVGGKSIYNLGVGVYDVDVEAGPSYTTKRQESAEAMIELSRANPTMWQTHGDLIVKSQDWPDAEEFAKRSKLTLPPEIREAIDAEEGQEAVDPAVLAAQAETKQLRQMAEQAIAEREEILAKLAAENEALQQQLKSKEVESAAKLKGAETDQYEAETSRMQALAPAMTPEIVSQIVAQTVQEIMNTPVPQPPPDSPAPLEPGPEPGFFMPEGV